MVILLTLIFLSCCRRIPLSASQQNFRVVHSLSCIACFPFTPLWSDLQPHHLQIVYVNTTMTLTLILLYSLFSVLIFTWFLSSIWPHCLCFLKFYFLSFLMPFLLVMLLLIWNLCLIILCRLIFFPELVLGIFSSLTLCFVPGWGIQAS